MPIPGRISSRIIEAYTASLRVVVEDEHNESLSIRLDTCWRGVLIMVLHRSTAQTSSNEIDLRDRPDSARDASQSKREAFQSPPESANRRLLP